MTTVAYTMPLLAGLALGGAVAWTRRGPARAIRRAFAAWGRGEGSIYDLMDADTEIVIPGVAAHCGSYRKDAFLRDVAGPFGARFAKPPVPKLRHLWANGDTIAVMADGTGAARDGQSYANAYVFAFAMDGRRVRRVTEFLDMAAFNAVWDRIEPEPAYVQ